MKELLAAQIKESTRVQEKLCNELLPEIISAADLLIRAFQNGKKLLICGNGGSAADAQHCASELVNVFQKRRAPLPAIALTTDTSLLTSISNDISFDQVFSRQIEALADKGDVLLALSTSGSSENVLKAVESAEKKGMVTIGLTGVRGSTLADCVRCALMVPSTDTPRIQEAHILIIHLLCKAVEDTLFT